MTMQRNKKRGGHFEMEAGKLEKMVHVHLWLSNI